MGYDGRRTLGTEQSERGDNLWHVVEPDGAGVARDNGIDETRLCSEFDGESPTIAVPVTLRITLTGPGGVNIPDDTNLLIAFTLQIVNKLYYSLRIYTGRVNGVRAHRLCTRFPNRWSRPPKPRCTLEKNEEKP